MASVNNIAAMREAKGWQRPELARRMGTSAQQLERLEKGQRKLTQGWIDKAADALGVSPAAIITPGQPDTSAGMPRLPDTIDKAPDRPPVVGSGAIQLKRVDLGLSMGDGTNLDDYFEEEPFEFDAGLLSTITRAPPHRVIIARGDGDSMMPTLINDDMVAIDTTQTSLNRMDKIWAISLHGAGGIKRLNRLAGGKVEIASDNPTIPPKIADEADLIILGRVVWVGRRM